MKKIILLLLLFFSFSSLNAQYILPIGGINLRGYKDSVSIDKTLRLWKNLHVQDTAWINGFPMWKSITGGKSTLNLGFNSNGFSGVNVNKALKIEGVDFKTYIQDSITVALQKARQNIYDSLKSIGLTFPANMESEPKTLITTSGAVKIDSIYFDSGTLYYILQDNIPELDGNLLNVYVSTAANINPTITGFRTSISRPHDYNDDIPANVVAVSGFFITDTVGTYNKDAYLFFFKDEINTYNIENQNRTVLLNFNDYISYRAFYSGNSSLLLSTNANTSDVNNVIGIGEILNFNGSNHSESIGYNLTNTNGNSVSISGYLNRFISPGFSTGFASDASSIMGKGIYSNSRLSTSIGYDVYNNIFNSFVQGFGSTGDGINTTGGQFQTMQFGFAGDIPASTSDERMWLSSGDTTERKPVIPDNATWNYTVSVTMQSVGNGAGDTLSESWQGKGVLRNINGTTTLRDAVLNRVSPVAGIDSISIVADDSRDTFDVRVWNTAGSTIHVLVRFVVDQIWKHGV